ncbi:uncharacterized protein KD926_010396 [Aspergillus affinis]|uniref:uncharacterized protein n=1 Tax=Aspergillus affinis TaxID=1070780 RepID=UPI0022FE3D25|nr:uncharacterized protein KD926_010396 [Aspergillus affinis]KAI9045073.1 hypothetical protein KD926_010396 [Aspergillus affinis]
MLEFITFAVLEIYVLLLIVALRIGVALVALFQLIKAQATQDTSAKKKALSKLAFVFFTPFLGESVFTPSGYETISSSFTASEASTDHLKETNSVCASALIFLGQEEPAPDKPAQDKPVLPCDKDIPLSHPGEVKASSTHISPAQNKPVLPCDKKSLPISHSCVVKAPVIISENKSPISHPGAAKAATNPQSTAVISKNKSPISHFGPVKASTNPQMTAIVSENEGLSAFIYASSSQQETVTTGEKGDTLLTVSSAQVSTIIQNKEPVKMPVLANVDDTAGFMAAARSFMLSQPSYASAKATSPIAAEEATGEQDETWKSADEFTRPSTSASAVAVDANDAKSVSVANEISSFAETPKHEIAFVSKNALSFATEAGAAFMRNPDEEENRENLTTFETWGTPASRAKPAARVRTVIIRGLPSTWATPTKVLSLVHGGRIENVCVSPRGIAHIRFCEADACLAFYEKYPNGIDLDKSRKVTVFVDMGKDVDVISSQLSFNLSVGATRVVRAVGVDLEVTMQQMIDLATAQNRKIEKIVDSWVPGEARSASFHFCTIEDAVRFRAAIIRDTEWEHCNVQYGSDPCDFATGIHVD